MNKLLVVIFIGISISCTKTKVDPLFKRDFNDAINTIDSFEKIRGPFIGYKINDSILTKFYFSQSYLNHLTGVFANVQYLDEIPFYSNRKVFEDDKKKWLNWFEKHKYSISKDYSDSIKQVVWNSKIWW